MRRVQDERHIGRDLSMTFIALLLSQNLGLCRAQAQAQPATENVASAISSQPVANLPVAGLISRIGDTTHLEFRGRQQWTYESPKKENDTIKVVMPPFDDKTVVTLQTWACPLIKKIDVNRKGPDGNFELTIHLTAKQVESFDYLTDDPSYLVFDFYKPNSNEKTAEANPEIDSNEVQKSKTAAKSKAATAKKSTAKTAASEDYKKLDRKPASDEVLQVAQAQPGNNSATVLSQDVADKDNINTQFERGIFDGGDRNFDRFRIKDYQIKEESIIAGQQNIYIRYPMLALKSNRFDDLMKESPIYEIKAEENDENKEARFLLTLFNKKRWGTFFKTYEYFQKKHPESVYYETIKHLVAEAHIALYQRDHSTKDFEAFHSMYQYLVQKYPNSVLAERDQLLVAYSSLQEKDGAEALRNLQIHSQKYPNSKERDYDRLAKGECYVLLGKPDDAIQAYQDVIKDPLDKVRAVEAAYRIGDVYFGQRQYAKAIETYQDVIKKYPQFSATFPNAAYNLSESEFWTGKYKQSLNDFIDFVSLAPSHEHGGFALTRIGELLQILGAEQSRVVGAFVESYFRYPNSQGSEVARIRMLSQGLKGMKEREKKRALEEINEIAKKSTLPQIKEFTTLVIADGLSRRNEFGPSLELLLTYYQKYPTTANLSVFKARILRNVSDILKDQIENKKFIEALNFYGKYTTTWLKNANRIDTDYFQAEAFEQAGAPQEAAKTYRRIAEHLEEIAGTKEEKERRVYEHLPTRDEVRLRLAATAVSERQYRDAFGYLQKIKNLPEPKEEIERVQISAEVAEQMGDAKAAIRNLEKLATEYIDQNSLMVQPEIHLTKLYLKTKEFGSAEKQLKKLERMHENKEVLNDEQWSQVLEMKGDLLFGEGQKLAAVQAYQSLLDSYETSRPLASIRYRTGKILFEEGDLKGAEKIWSQLDEKTGGLYKHLAQEKIQQAEWQDTYRKYIDRIPAAQDLK